MPSSELFLNTMLAVLSLVLLAVGTYSVLVLKEVHRLLRKLNSSLNIADTQIQKITNSLQQLGNFTTAFQAGVKTIEAIREHLTQRKKEQI